jgi:ribosomal protein S27AE
MLAIKTCYDCGQSKPLSEYYRHPQMSDGHLNKCKECQRAATIANRTNRLAYYQEYDRKRGNLPHRVVARSAYAEAMPPEQKKSYNLRWVKRNPQKRVAHIIAGNAIRDGRLVKQPCEMCGEVDVDAHHDDYSKPLTVRWFCRACHMNHHKEERSRERAGTRSVE